MKITKREEIDDMGAAWLAERPPEVRKLAEEFPLGCVFDVEMHGVPLTFYLLGYTEDDRLIVSLIDPVEDFRAALDNKLVACAAHFREPH